MNLSQVREEAKAAGFLVYVETQQVVVIGKLGGIKHVIHLDEDSHQDLKDILYGKKKEVKKKVIEKVEAPKKTETKEEPKKETPKVIKPKAKKKKKKK